MTQNLPKRILCIRLSAMGDVAMTVPVLLSLTAKYPQLEITVVSKSQFKPIFTEIPQVTFQAAEVKGQHSGIFGIYKLYRSLKTEDFHAVADLHNVIRSKVLRNFFRLRGIKIAIIDKGRAEKKHLTQLQPKTLHDLKSTHERYADVFRKLGFAFALSPEALLQKKQLPSLKQLHKLTGKWLGMAPFATHPGKEYPEDLLLQCLDLLVNENLTLLLFGAPGSESEKLSTWADAYPNVHNLAGELDFKDELAVISNLDLMLAMDSGNGHLAAMYGVPVITLWGVTHPCLGFAPFNQPKINQITSDRELFPMIPTSVYGNKLPVDYERVMQTISPERVIEKVKEILV
ncbi:MAG: glycosyltransferase family 9 protein [Leeuwenhoekiella sp.]